MMKPLLKLPDSNLIIDAENHQKTCIEIFLLPLGSLYMISKNS